MAVTKEASGLYKLTAAGDTISGTTIVKKIRWVFAEQAGDSLYIEDVDGNEVFASVANGVNFVDESDFPEMPVKGLNITTLGSGSVYIYG